MVSLSTRLLIGKLTGRAPSHVRAAPLDCAVGAKALAPVAKLKHADQHITPDRWPLAWTGVTDAGPGYVQGEAEVGGSATP